MIAAYWTLVLLTLRQPVEAAQLIYARNLSREVLWMGLALSAVLSTLIFNLSLVFFPMPGPSLDGQPVLLMTPVTMLIVQASVMAITVFGLFWAGRAMGGTGRFADVLAAVTWMQLLWVLVQLAALVMTVILPGLSGILVMAAGIYGLWLHSVFLDQAHHFGSVGKGFFLLLLTAFGLIIGALIFLTVIGAAALGLS